MTTTTTTTRDKDIVVGKSSSSEAASSLSSSSSSSSSVAVACAFVSALGAFAFGYNLAVVNGPLEAIARSATGVANNLTAQGSIVSTLLVGATVGSLVAGKIVDACGRRMSQLYCGVLLAVGPGLCVFSATSLPGILAGRFLTGVGIGIASSLVPLYISEVSPKNLRGSLGSVNQLTICLGIVLGLLANLVYAPHQWRAMFGIAAVPGALLALLAATFLPETPAFLASRGKVDEAEKQALRLWGESRDVEVNDVESSKPAEGGGESIFSKAYRKVLVVSVLMFVFQQMSGINSIVFFSSSMFHDIGVQNPAVASLIVGLVNLVGTMFTGYLVDRAGRKQLMQVSYGGMALTLGVLSVVSSSGLSHSLPFAPLVILASILAYMFSFALGAGAIPGMYVSEIGGDCRAQASSVAFTTHWIMNILIGQYFLQLTSQFGVSALYAVFALSCLCALVFVNRVCSETKGKSFDEIKKDFLLV
ncbi:MFS general substrate transporter [Chloropicon primus]|uniref:MFS general substrate transporter n=1 Tax=Chloropicon primus TaxID=1764295 RepID=A0A5B8MRR0_9CHLO|nr:MFS general substrate transporter [Chloropicon primus]UPR02491.1 MFS general substrate transporter [Chloropicon primus]|eukprot:QDZ23279.1 MFS general substrate transporter [Chloropicon primus]